MSHLPTRFTSASNDVQKEVVSLGLKCWDILEGTVLQQQNFDLANLLTQAKEEGTKEGKRTATKEYEPKLAQLETQLTHLQARLERETIQQETQLKDAEKKYQREYDRKIELLVREGRFEERELLQQTHKEEIQNFQRQLTSLQIDLASLNAKKGWEDAYHAERKEREALHLQLQELTRAKTSYELGKEGEEEINTILSQIPEWDFQEVHKEKGKADFRATSKELKTFILDAKNYTNAVPKKEREKIVRDVDNDSSVLGGLLVSLSSKVQTKDHCEIELTPTKKPICYLVLEGLSPQAKQSCIQATLRLLLQYVASTNEREKDDLLSKIQQAFLKLGELKSETENQRNKAKDLYESLKVSVDRIQRILNFLQDKADEGHGEEKETPKRTARKKKGVEEST